MERCELLDKAPFSRSPLITRSRINPWIATLLCARLRGANCSLKSVPLAVKRLFRTKGAIHGSARRIVGFRKLVINSMHRGQGILEVAEI